MGLKVLLVGSGGREHALAWKLVQSGLVEKLFVAPGSAGIAELNKVELVDKPAHAIDELVQFACDKNIDLTVVGPEGPLVAGIVDEFLKKDLNIFGPTRAAAQLEGSKAFAEKLRQKHGIPTVDIAGAFSDEENARQFIKQHPNTPWVVKADGLAAGKGVLMPNLSEPDLYMTDTMGRIQKVRRRYGSDFVVEQFITGEEVSIIGISDGKSIESLESCQDHKRLENQDLGPNTGGMGTYSPARPSLIEGELSQIIQEKIMAATIRAMQNEGTPFVGFLYAGLMITPRREAKVLEYNVRFGDPETQAILPRLKSDLARILVAATIDKNVQGISFQWEKSRCVCIVLASRGYPDKPEIGFPIMGIEEAKATGALVFHAGTRREDKKWLTAGGRVLNVVALGETYQEARDKAYRAAKLIRFEGKHMREDIAIRAVNNTVGD